MRRSYEERKTKKEFKMNLVNRIKDLTPKERAGVVEELLREKHTIPYSSKDEISKATLYRWLKEFRENKNAETVLLGKVRCDRGICKKLADMQKSALKRWRYDNPYRSLEDLREELASHDETTSDPLPSLATIARFLRSENLSRKNLLKGIKPQGKVRLAFEADYPQQIWMADTKGPDIYVADPDRPGESIQAKPITLLDDNSRYAVAVMYTIVENEYAVMDLFCQAVVLYGIPEIFYVDRGGPYMGKALKKAANLIGCNIIHTSKQDPSAKGKIEKILRTFHERFEHEMKAQGKDGIDLLEYNRYLQAYVGQDYNRSVHASTKASPEERFFAFPAEKRRFISKDALSRIFLPIRTAVVTKTGLVRVNNLKYLVNDASLCQKKVEVRCPFSDKSKVYVWYQDQFYGEAHVYTEENDFMKREKLTEMINTVPEIILPELGEVPLYGRLDRQLAKHREEMAAMDINEQLAASKQKKGQIRAELLKEPRPDTVTWETKQGKFEVDQFIYLLMKLLRKKFTPSERLAAHTLWNSAGPIDEKLVRRTVGELLGNEYPTEDIKGYLEEIRLAVLTNKYN
jgi:transposase InsO family protein